jgi:hypothetical protein
VGGGLIGLDLPENNTGVYISESRMGSKRIKLMQNSEELRQNGHDRSQRTCRKKGKIFSERGGGGINIVFGTKYRPLK